MTVCAFLALSAKSDFVITEDTVISGIWIAHDYYSVSYNWNNAPSGVTLPNSVTKLKSGDSVTVDTTYTSESTSDIIPLSIT